MNNIEIVKQVTPALVKRIQSIIVELTEPRCPITVDSLKTIVDDKESEFIVAKDDSGKVIGAMCLMVYQIPTTKKAFIEDVVVAKEARGKGYGEAMISKALELAKEKGVKYIELSSNSKRIAANALYQKLGFKVRDTNFYRLEF